MKRDTNTHYEWPSGSAVTQVDVRTQKNGQAVAYLYADPATPKDKLLEIRSALRLKGWGTLSDNRDGKFGLRVSGMKDDGKELLSVLSATGSTSGNIHITQMGSGADKPSGLWATIKAHSLRISAATYALGDLFYYKGSDNSSDKRMALSFAFGDIMLGMFGGSDDGKQYQSLLQKLSKHMQSNGIEIPKNSAIHVEADLGKIGKDSIGGFLHRHINSIKIASEVLGGWFVFKSGLGKTPAERNIFKLISGPIIMAGWAGALLVKEKKKDPEALDQAGALDKAISYIQEKPLRLAGGAGLTFNALKITDTLVNDRKTGGWNRAGVGSMIAANALYGISNKTVGGDIKTQEMVSDVYLVASQILNKQPLEQREAAILSTAKFLGERPEIKDTHSEILARLRKEMEIQRQNPWFENITLPARTQSASPAPALVQAPLATPKPTIDATNATHIAKGVAESAQLEQAAAR